MFFKKKRILEQKKIEDQMIEVAKEFLSGKIHFEELINIFLGNDKILVYFNEHIKIIGI